MDWKVWEKGCKSWKSLDSSNKVFFKKIAVPNIYCFDHIIFTIDYFQNKLRVCSYKYGPGNIYLAVGPEKLFLRGGTNLGNEMRKRIYWE